jgi:hypothetical protein
VDHVIPHEGDPVKFWKGPFESLCHPHHSAKTAREINAKGRGVEKFTIGERTEGGTFDTKKIPNVENFA